MNKFEIMIAAAKSRRDSGIKNKPPENNLIRRYGLDTKSRKEAIFMMCFSCQGGDADVMPDPGWKVHIRECGITACPLYKFRPYQGN